jgi:uncharacterized damage-inducible protein DinB
MTVPADVLRLHLDYSRWASARLIEAASTLTREELVRDFATADKSVLGTMVHIFGADRVWLGRVRGAGPGTRPGPEFNDLAVLDPAWRGVLDEWLAWASAMADSDFEPDLSYHDLKGNAWRTPLWQVVLHLVNHATHHRGQAAGFLRSMGHVPPALDLIAFYRSRA